MNERTTVLTGKRYKWKVSNSPNVSFFVVTRSITCCFLLRRLFGTIIMEAIDFDTETATLMREEAWNNLSL